MEPNNLPSGEYIFDKKKEKQQMAERASVSRVKANLLPLRVFPAMLEFITAYNKTEILSLDYSPKTLNLFNKQCILS